MERRLHAQCPPVVETLCGETVSASPVSSATKRLDATLTGDAEHRPVRPYAFAPLTKRDRLVVASAPMMENTWTDIKQIYRYSDCALLRTLALPAGNGLNGQLLFGAERAGFGPRVLEDGAVFLNSYGCTFSRASDIGSDAPRFETDFALATPAADVP